MSTKRNIMRKAARAFDARDKAEVLRLIAAAFACGIAQAEKRTQLTPEQPKEPACSQK